MKRLIDIDDDALERARKTLGLPTIKATVNAALRLAAGDPVAGETRPGIDDAIDALAGIEFDERATAWR
ncbi:hypothetical protein FOE78_02230 [Microlunatus elymi]|uniref:Antitoxin of type II TA system, VapB n=1 Tax=Microlunatus elymi TaxID=2596828 RepID=A0A516PUT4_9ACTN|nr:type II toxin-antitoxin system VapB family antitoxin [Microlunatus elymi]QDP94890.1 hypothetical protein FOE78_02230 [Microlunatus elymi]